MDFYQKSRFLTYRGFLSVKAELPQEGIFFPLNFLSWEFLSVKKLEIEKN